MSEKILNLPPHLTESVSGYKILGLRLLSVRILRTLFHGVLTSRETVEKGCCSDS